MSTLQYTHVTLPRIITHKDASGVLPNALSGWRVCGGGGGGAGGGSGGGELLGVTERDRDRECDLQIIMHSISFR